MKLIERLRRWFRRPARQLPAAVEHDTVPEPRHHSAMPLPYDEQLLERSRTQWQFGDWQSLARIEREKIEHHPDRAKLALLAAAGRMQLGESGAARGYLRLAQDWGAGKRLISQVMVAGVHNSLGRAAVVGKRNKRAFNHFQQSIQLGSPAGDSQLLTRARSTVQIGQLGLKAQPGIGLGRLPAGGGKGRGEGRTLTEELNNRRSPRELAEHLNKNGEKLYAIGQYRLAADYFQRATELSPARAWYCQNLAEALARSPGGEGEAWENDYLNRSIAEGGRRGVVERLYRKALMLDSDEVERYHAARRWPMADLPDDAIPDPIFIIGAAHSGGSQLHALLGHHPALHPVTDEDGLLLRSDEAITTTLSQWDQACRQQGRSCWVESTPSHIFQIGRLLAHRPRARLILMLRDGRDVVTSLRAEPGLNAIEERIDCWVRDNQAALTYRDHPQLKVVRYESLCNDSEATIRALRSFLAIDYPPQLPAFLTDMVARERGEADQGDRQPLWQREMGRGERERFKLSPAQQLLEQFGYVSDNGW